MKTLCILILLCFVLSANAETVRVLYYPDKTVKIIHPAPNSKKKGETEQQWLERVFNKSTPDGIEYEDMDANELPAREDRNAWEGEKGKKVKVNQEKKQELDQAKAKKIQDKVNAKTKLKNLGLSDDEVESIISK